MNDDDQAELERWALQVRCPRCGRPPGVPCYEWTRHAVVNPHPSRVALGAAQ